jgi:hypothetical protein
MFSAVLKSQALLWWVLLLPLVEVGFFVFVRRSVLSSPWLFSFAGLLTIYVIVGVAAYRELVGIGISGSPSAQPDSAVPVVVLGFAYLVLTAAVFWGIGFLFRRTA